MADYELVILRGRLFFFSFFCCFHLLSRLSCVLFMHSLFYVVTGTCKRRPRTLLSSFCACIISIVLWCF